MLYRVSSLLYIHRLILLPSILAVMLPIVDHFHLLILYIHCLFLVYYVLVLFFVCILYISRQITGWHIYHQYLQQRSPTVDHFHPLMTHSIYLQQSTSRYIENIIMHNMPFTSTIPMYFFNEMCCLFPLHMQTYEIIYSMTTWKYFTWTNLSTSKTNCQTWQK